MYSVYQNAYQFVNNLNIYIFSNKITAVNNTKRWLDNITCDTINIYMPASGSITVLKNTSINNSILTWTNGTDCVYNAARNIYIYPVSNVAASYTQNENLPSPY
jgi:hypothetical protein